MKRGHWRGAWGLAAALLGLPAVGQMEGPPEGASQYSCFEAARQGSSVSESIAAQLCQGARSDTPARCFLRVQEKGFLADPQALQLCQYAQPSDDPAACFFKARTSSFLDETQLLELCRPPIAQMLKMCPYGP
ncbi:hypothetical protein D7Y27_23085 [Corallococcus sp. AB004]|uniref:hypothetical protein n=1 Tax=Corallococcus TaxID=83461 RepID=UPI000EA0892F|nr:MULTISPECIES: hypothetical protein [Corallococcus]NRD53584.1 hypothetical protein [Corallococcus exiguus]RKI11782.1 hypothetical protein D7Y15_19530 [Corallococcus sp. AB030]RKI38838.1 hypothetical protein D7Y27_23085 [Corallococcus sp. AB004]RUO91188.1 hypothetical protein D7Y11_21400 [Corallococcus sp. AB018]